MSFDERFLGAAVPDTWEQTKRERAAMERDAGRYQYLRQGPGLTVIIPTPTDEKPEKKVTVIFAPIPEGAYAEALDAAVDAAIKGGPPPETLGG